MSDKSSIPFWDIDWLESQRQYLDVWKSFSETLPDVQSKTGLAMHPWVEVMETWWRDMSPDKAEGNQQVFMNMMDQGKVFNTLSEQFTHLLQGINELSSAGKNWQELLNSQFEEIKSQFAQVQSKAGAPTNSMWSAWQLLPMDTFQRTFSSSSILPGDFLEDLKPEELQRVTDKFLSIPGVGYTRESQEQFQKGIRLWGEYQKTSYEYITAMNKVGVNALESMRIRILEMPAQGKQISSLREIYDLWVDCNEETYAAYAYTDEFSDLYGRLTNALMALKKHGRNIVDETLGALNMPTRKGMNTVQRRQHELWREYKIAELKIKTLEAAIQEIHKTIKKGNKGLITKKKTSATSRKKISKKKTAKKKSIRKTRSKKAAKNKVIKKTEANRNLKQKKSAKKKGSSMSNKDNMIVIKI
jgi:class III poly(R)-hydroxyalkanoic acid synthase PhaE subunit